MDSKYKKEPPILPDIINDLQEYLLKPERLPIHDYRKLQQLLPKDPDIFSLFLYEPMPPTTDIKTNRDPVTGEVIGYEEINSTNSLLTAKNSMSFTRAPTPSSHIVKGNPSNLPFFPGGFPEIDIDVHVETCPELFEDLLTIPPGFKRGIDFDTIEAKKELGIDQHGDTEDIINLLSVDNDHNLSDLWKKEEVSNDKIKEEKQSAEVNLNDADIIPSESSLPVLKISESSKDTVLLQHTKWAKTIDVNKPVLDFDEKIPHPAYKYEFELDNFQKQAILKLEEHKNVLVAAHTSAGKTVVAEYAIALSQQHMTRTIYTSPIKALSNQKYRDFMLKFKDVGLVTGDFQINVTGVCLIMTTEILRSMLYCGSDVIRDLEYVIFDEVHYINDSDRGHVWEEVLILLPAHVTIVMLSATIPNALEFADWVGRTKQRTVYVISTYKRPVPLVHYLYVNSTVVTKNKRYLLLDADGNFNLPGYNEAISVKQGRCYPGDFKSERNYLNAFVKHLQTDDKLPVVFFTFNRRRCDQNADLLMDIIDLLDCSESTANDDRHHSEKHHVFTFFNHAIERLKKPDQELPQVIKMKNLLLKGIGVHHSGILPILKEIVERLFQSGHVKLLFATETFAMGVNMPARTVVFDSIRKHDGYEFRTLLPAEYIQMAGRAGRRGHDTNGTVIISCMNFVPDIVELKLMMLGKPQILVSKFRLTYGMLLNLPRVESLTVENMMSHSFCEASFQNKVIQYKNELKTTEQKISELYPDEPMQHQQNLIQFYNAASRYLSSWLDFQPTFITNCAQKEMVPGRILLISCKSHINKLAMLLKINARKDVKYIVLVLNHQKFDEDDTEKKTAVSEEYSEDWYKILALAQSDVIFKPDGVGGHEVLEITADNITNIVNKVIKIDTAIVIQDWEKRQILRFRNDPPSQTCQNAIQELTKLTYNAQNTQPEFVDIRVSNIDLRSKQDEVQRLKKIVDSYMDYTKIANFEQHFKAVFHRRFLEEKRDYLKTTLSHESLKLYPEYMCRIAVLSELGYIDENHIVKMKGHVAREIGSNELIITELVFQNTLTNMEPTEIAAVLSGLVFQAKTEIQEIDDVLKPGIECLIAVYNRILQLEKKHGLIDSGNMESDNKELNFGLAHVVYTWAKQEPFTVIMTLTDVQEGIIVRCIQQLNEIICDIRDAARIIGNPILQTKMEEASNAIKRDIVFTPSLYTQRDSIMM